MREKVCSPSVFYSLIILSWLLLLFFSFLAVLGWGNDLCSLLGVGGWDDEAVNWETELLDEEFNTLVGEEIVGPSPVVNLVEASSGLEGLNDHHNVKVGAGGDLLMSWQVSILLDNNNSLLEEVLED